MGNKYLIRPSDCQIFELDENGLQYIDIYITKLETLEHIEHKINIIK